MNLPTYPKIGYHMWMAPNRFFKAQTLIEAVFCPYKVFSEQIFFSSFVKGTCFVNLIHKCKDFYIFTCFHQLCTYVSSINPFQPEIQYIFGRVFFQFLRLFTRNEGTHDVTKDCETRTGEESMKLFKKHTRTILESLCWSSVYKFEVSAWKNVKILAWIEMNVELLKF